MKISRRKAIEKTLIAATGTTLFSNLTKPAQGEETGKSKNTYLLKREIPVSGKYDVVIAGGGPAGVAAAVCSARLGAKVLLLEATGCLGGMGTSGLVTAFDPMANGKELLVGGFMREILFDMYKRGFLGPQEKPEVFTKAYHHWTPFNAEGYKLLLDEKVVDAGVEVRFFTKVIDAEADNKKGKIEGIIINNIEGYEFIPSKTFIDCTGDAVLADLCGATCREAGKDTPNIMPATLCSYFVNIDFKNSTRVGTEHPILLKAIENGHFTQTDRHLPGLSQVGDTIGYLN
ncbi:FAD-dependent oxidoreductase, partial [Mariniphaga sediminis]|uniref:FAD-dependent oxidoreductase n=1 Tax=Mariniphaga sediminis TaxID=1628158 RepID=UPI003565C07A